MTIRELEAIPQIVFSHCLPSSLPLGGRFWQEGGGLPPCLELLNPGTRPQDDWAAGNRTWVYLCSLTCPDQRGVLFLCVSPAPHWWHCTPGDGGGGDMGNSGFRAPFFTFSLVSPGSKFSCSQRHTNCPHIRAGGRV